MQVFKYTLRKYFSYPSTWVILLISLAFVFFIDGVVILKLNGDYKSSSASQYTILVITLYGTTGTMFVTFSSIFTGFVGAKVFRDEIEDGTFLIIISKRITRKQIMIEKWISFILAVFIFCIVMNLGFVFGTLIFDKPDPSNYDYQAMLKVSPRGNLFKAFSMMTGIGFIVAFIFSSISLLFSSKLSGSGTIGATIALGIAVPISSFIGTFTSDKTELTQNFLGPVAQSMDQSKNLLWANGITNNDINKGSTFELKIGDKDMKKKINSIDDLSQMISFFYSSVRTKEFSTIGIKEFGSSSFSNVAWMDLKYQMGQLSSMTTSTMIPDDILNKSVASFGVKNQFPPTLQMKQEVTGQLSKTEINQKINEVEYAGASFKTSLNKVLNSHKLSKDKDLINIETIIPFSNLDKVAKRVLNTSEYKEFQDKISGTSNKVEKIKRGLNYLTERNKIKSFKLTNYIDRRIILGVYIALAVILSSITFALIIKKDFA